MHQHCVVPGFYQTACRIFICRFPDLDTRGVFRQRHTLPGPNRAYFYCCVCSCWVGVLTLYCFHVQDCCDLGWCMDRPVWTHIADYRHWRGHSDCLRVEKNQHSGRKMFTHMQWRWFLYINIGNSIVSCVGGKYERFQNIDELQQVECICFQEPTPEG